MSEVFDGATTRRRAPEKKRTGQRFWRAITSRSRTMLAAVAVATVAISGLGAASMATAAQPKMTWNIAPSETTVLSGGSISYKIDIECSNLDQDACVTPTLTIDQPEGLNGNDPAGGQVVATNPVVSADGVTVTDNGSTASIVFENMAPGTSRQVLLTWRLPNFTVLPDTVLNTGGGLTYEVPGGQTVTDVEPLTPPAAVTTNAEPAVTATKSMLSPDAADKVFPNMDVTYRLNVCLPGDRLGQLDYTHITIVDTLTVEPAEPAGSKATIVSVNGDTNLDGATLSADGRVLTWDIDVSNPDDRPLCGTEQAIVKDVTIHYPEGMRPTSGGGAVANRTVNNHLDVSVTTITGEVLTEEDEQTHAFTVSSDTGGNRLQPYQQAPSPGGIVKGRQGTADVFKWQDNLNWRLRGNESGTDLRSTATYDAIACMTNVIDGVPTSLPLTGYGVNEAKELLGIFAPSTSYTAPVLPAQCDDPAFRTQTVRVAIANAGEAQEDFRLTGYWVNLATGAKGSTTIYLHDLAVGSGTDVPVYDASGFGLTSDQVLTDILAVTSPTQAQTSFWNLQLMGVQSDSFVASDYMEMANHFISYSSETATGRTIDSISGPDAESHARAGSQIKSFLKETLIPSVEKTSDQELDKLKPGDEVEWKIKVGNSDLSENVILPELYDVLPKGLEYVEGSASWSGLDGKSAPTETVETVPLVITSTLTEDRQKITWTFSDDFAPGETAEVTFKTLVTLDAQPGSHSNNDAQFAAVLDQNGDINDNLTSGDRWDLDGDGNTNERVQVSTKDWTITSESGAKVAKYVKGSAGDGEWKIEDVSIAALADDDSDATTGTDVDYRLDISNPGSLSIKDLVIYDVLPYVGDTGIGASLAGESRGSEFQVDFAKLLSSLPDGVKVYYSTSENPERSELGVTTGDGTWSDTVGDPAEVRALKFTIDSLAPGEDLTIDYRGTVPVFEWNQPDQVCLSDTSLKAWNNVAFQADAVLTDGVTVRELLPAEAPRVSIREVCGYVGDYAWFDDDSDGIQGSDELPAEGVVFQLVDADGNDVKDADGNLVQATTDADGKYGFNVPVGDWAVRVVEAPEGYVATKPNQGEDNAVDSDIPAVGTVSEYVSITPDHLEDLTLDAGFVGVVKVGDYVWEDTNNDGIQDPEEPGIPGVVLKIVDPEGNPVVDVHGNEVPPVTTGPDGEYVFPDLPVLPEGESYKVIVETPPAGYSPTKEHEGDDPSKDSSTGEETTTGLNNPGDEDTTLDFGFVPSVSVGDYVWADRNDDGIQNDGPESALAGVTLTLVGPDGKPVTDVTGTLVEPVVTDVNGAYSFDDLPVLKDGQSYTVKVTTPSGFLPAKTGQGDRATDSSTGEASSEGLTEKGQRDSTLDFGFIPVGQIGDYVWYDKDRDGIQDPEGTPVPGVTFQLLDGEGNPVLDENGEIITAVTDENGYYHFDVPIGEYSVQIIEIPDGYDFTAADQGGDDALDSDVPGLNVPTPPVSITWDNLINHTLDAGLIGSVSVGDYVWADADRDGVQDKGEKGIEGVTLTITGPDGQPVTDINGNPVAPVVTDEKGAYEFTNLPVLEDGQSYTVTVTDPAGYVPTKAGTTGRDKDSSTGSASSEGLTEPNDRDSTLDFGFIPAVSVGDYVWEDTNNNGLQDEGEPGIPGVELEIVGPDGKPVVNVFDEPVGPVTTDENGFYNFPNLPTLPEGEHYTVTVKDPEGYEPAKPNQGDDPSKDSSTGEEDSKDLTNPGDRDDTLDFGFVPTVSVGDYVWYDVNNNGIQDDGEPGIKGVELTLTGPDGKPVTDVNGNPVKPVTTDENGYYSFEKLPVLPAGQHYTVSVKDPAGYKPAKPGQGGDPAKDSSTGSAESGALTKRGDRDATLDFGFVGTVTVGDYVWFDTNNDGIQGKDEKGIEGVELTLTGPDGQPVTDVNGNPVGPVKTDANGYYEFADLPVLADGQSYTVSVATPAGFVPAKANQGKDRAKDSSTGSETSQGLNAPGDVDSTLDFGFIPVGEIGDYVWFDTDRDGVQDPNEKPAPGVVFELLDENGDPVLDENGNPVRTTTDENGWYHFEVPIGTWSVQIVSIPEGYAFTTPNAGGDDAVDSDALGLNISFGPVTITPDNLTNYTLDAGLVATVTVGDFIWVDLDADGVQDEGEPGIPDVWVTVYGPDGQPAVDVWGNPVESVKTDKDGHYIFENLPVLEEGQSYTVKIDRERTLKDNPEFAKYAPTLANVGDRATDSDDWSASSQGLTGPGESDLTLDFGFVPGEPIIDIEKFDTDGNDADTKEESVVLPDGTQDLVFEVTNLGNEDLVNIKVTDEIITGSGTISELVGTLADGTAVGAEWEGPLAPGAKITYTATLTGVVAGEAHLNTGTVTADGRWSGTPVTDEDDYNGHTPKPGILIEKFDEEGNDADTVAETVKITGSSQQVIFRITNTGDEALKNVVVSDVITDGSAKVENLVCSFPDGSTGTTWKGEFSPGASFECTATVTGLAVDDQHTDIASVTGEGVESGKKVESSNPYNVIRVTELAVTGGQISLIALVLGLALLSAGGILYSTRRRFRIEEA